MFTLTSTTQSQNIEIQATPKGHPMLRTAAATATLTLALAGTAAASAILNGNRA